MRSGLEIRMAEQERISIVNALIRERINTVNAI